MIVFGCLLALVGATSLPAQTVTEEAHRVLAEGVTAFEAEDYARAAALLEPVVAVTPALADDRWGSAAYWLGRAYEHLDERERMQEAWRAGFRALEAAGLFDLRLADAYLRSLSDEQRVERADEAASLYLGLLSVLGQPLLPDEQALLARHMAQLALILPEALWDDVFDVGPGAVSDPQAWTYRPEAGEHLLAWWRSQDPLPATRRNERLHEHLVRVAYAERHFAYAGNPSGLDDRGEIYVRFGKPDKELEIRFTEPWLVDIVFQPGVGVSPSDFPENVFWRYGHIDRATYYLFVKKQDHFVIGETMDLLPSVLRFGFSPSERGVDKAVRMLAVLRSVYQQLAPLHSDFEARYGDVENYVMELPAFQPGRILNRTRRSVPLPPSPAPPSGRARPDVFAQTILLRTQTEDEIAYGRRENYSPLQATEVFRDRERLPIVTRVARFLDGDGTTRTEIYWSPPAGALYPDKKMRERLQDDGYRLDDYVINMTAVQMTADYRQRVVNQKRYFLTDVPPGDEGTIPVQTMVVRGDTGLYHLALQWDQYLPEGQRGRRVRIGPHVKVGTESIDSLRALRSDGRTLEMSDLKPLLARDGVEALLAPDAPDHAEPYPFAVITPEVNLALYFEIYHLAFGADDRAHYRVEYEVARREPTGGLLRFLGGRDEARTTSRYAGSSAGRMARELIVLDLSQWEGSGELEVHVRVTDETTGQTAERALRFTVQRPAG